MASADVLRFVNTMPCITSTIQAPLQCILRPAMWLPGIKNLHSHTEIWRSDKSPEDVLDAIVRAVPAAELNDTRGESYQIRKIDRDAGFLQVYAFTWANWLDVMEFTVHKNAIKARSFSTGLFPVSIPLIVILNCVFFWVPFYDNKFNSTRLDALRECMDIQITACDV